MTAPKRPRKGSERPQEAVSAGERLREAITGEFELSEAEAVLLEKACTTADLLARVEAEVASAPLVQEGSRGQPVSSPLIRTQIELQAHLVAVLSALRLPLGEMDDPQADGVSEAARRAAMIRWHGRAS